MIDYYFDKKLEIKAQQTILKQNSIKLMRELKDMKKTTYFNAVSYTHLDVYKRQAVRGDKSVTFG